MYLYYMLFLMHFAKKRIIYVRLDYWLKAMNTAIIYIRIRNFKIYAFIPRQCHGGRKRKRGKLGVSEQSVYSQGKNVHSYLA